MFFGVIDFVIDLGFAPITSITAQPGPVRVNLAPFTRFEMIAFGRHAAVSEVIGSPRPYMEGCGEGRIWAVRKKYI